MGNTAGWETRRRRQAERDREQDDACFAAGKAEARKDLLPLLERCLDAIQDGFRRKNPLTEPRGRAALLVDLRRELGKEG